MSQIPGFSLAALGTNASQQSQQSLPPNLNMLTAQQQALLAQHQQHQQRQQQSSPPQPQSLPGVTNPDNQRMWQAIDQQVRAHNDATTANPTYNQVSKFFFYSSRFVFFLLLYDCTTCFHVQPSFLALVGDRRLPPTFFARVPLHSRFRAVPHCSYSAELSIV